MTRTIEKIIIAAAFAAAFMLSVCRANRPLFLGEFNNIDGSIYWARGVDALVALAVFGAVSFVFIGRFLEKGMVAGFLVASAALVVLASGADAGLDRLLLRIFNLPMGPNEVSDKMLAYPIHDARSAAILPKNLVSFGLGLLYGLSRDWVMKRRNERDIALGKMQADVAFLRSQINPHFFFNSLNNIYAITQRNDDTEAGQAIVKLSELMRYMIYESNVDRISLVRELETIGYFIDVCRLRFAKDDEIDIQFAKEGHLNGQEIAPLLLLPFVENALKHGLDRKGRGWVRIAVGAGDGLLRFSVENSKFGGRETIRRHSGIGLANVRRRLDLLYPRRHELRVEETDDTFRVDLTLETED